LDLKGEDLRVQEGFLTFKTFNEKTFRREESQKFSFPRKGRFYPLIQVDVSTSTRAYKMMGPYVEAHLQSLRSPDEYIFGQYLQGDRPLKRSRAYQIVTGLDPGVWLHWFRHQRFTQVYYTIKTLVKEPTEVLDILHRFSHHTRIDTTLGYIKRIEHREIRKEI
jgi:hypothetical protein